ncbi:MAG: hypothetical protein NXI28_20645 [bacterium]|nr:hypothetical protein [bacterium]
MSVGFGDFSQITLRAEVGDHVILRRVKFDDRSRLQVGPAFDVLRNESGQPRRAPVIDQPNSRQFVVDVIVAFIEPLQRLVIGRLG